MHTTEDVHNDVASMSGDIHMLTGEVTRMQWGAYDVADMPSSCAVDETAHPCRLHAADAEVHAFDADCSQK